MGKMMEQGPVLIITFQAQMVMVVRDTKGEVVEGDPVSEKLCITFMIFVDLPFDKSIKGKKLTQSVS